MVSCLHILDFLNLQTMAFLKVISMDIDLNRLRQELPADRQLPEELYAKLQELTPIN